MTLPTTFSTLPMASGGICFVPEPARIARVSATRPVDRQRRRTDARHRREKIRLRLGGEIAGDDMTLTVLAG